MEDLIRNNSDRMMEVQMFSKLRVYDSSKPFDEYIKYYNTVMTGFNMNPGQAYRFLPMHLDENARAVYNSVKDLEEVTDFLTLVEAMRKKMSTPAAQALAKARLEVEMGNESLVEYSENVRSSINMAYHDFGEAEKQRLMVDYFVRGLPSHLKAKLMGKPFASLNEVVDKANYIETLRSLSKDDTVEQKIDALVNSINMMHVNVADASNYIGNQEHDEYEDYSNEPCDEYCQEDHDHTDWYGDDQDCDGYNYQPNNDYYQHADFEDYNGHDYSVDPHYYENSYHPMNGTLYANDYSDHDDSFDPNYEESRRERYGNACYGSGGNC